VSSSARFKLALFGTKKHETIAIWYKTARFAYLELATYNKLSIRATEI
jgi:hypothetical protein